MNKGIIDSYRQKDKPFNYATTLSVPSRYASNMGINGTGTTIWIGGPILPTGEVFAFQGSGAQWAQIPVTHSSLDRFQPLGERAQISDDGMFATAACSGTGGLFAILFQRSGDSYVQKKFVNQVGNTNPVYYIDTNLTSDGKSWLVSSGTAYVTGSTTASGSVRYSFAEDDFASSLTIPDPNYRSYGYWGRRVCMADNRTTLAVGNQTPNGKNSVTILERNGGVDSTDYSVQAVFTNPEGFDQTSATGGFGGVQLVFSPDSGTLFVSDNQVIRNGQRYGAIYVYKKINGTWSYHSVIDDPNPAIDSDYSAFGQFMNYKNNVLVACNRGAVVNGLASAGAVYLFKNSGTQWKLQQTIVSPNARQNGRFGGQGISADGKTLAIGEVTTDRLFYVYTRN